MKISIQVKSIIIAILFTGLGWQGSTEYHELKANADKQEPVPYAMIEGIDRYEAEMLKRKGR